ncbi:DUF397 domain-containing protein [Actinomadura sp. GTD37]|uniref:DUF397 domain-containing protein n=1 Tax=Actinomadura sp. GTD37 TaxID=1778030 RepID=UPI0035C00666
MDLSRVTWRKASRSTSNGGNCVEVASTPDVVAVRDSKDPNGPKLVITYKDFQRLTETLKAM